MDYNIRYASSEDAGIIVDFQQKIAMEPEGMERLEKFLYLMVPERLCCKRVQKVRCFQKHI
jgi:hypothetical protein